MPSPSTKKTLAAGDHSPPPSAMDSGGIPPPPSKRLVMVIADPSRESSVALQWALSHAILEQDDLILLRVEASNPTRRAGALSSLLRRPTPGNAGSQLALSSTSSSSSDGSGEGGECEFLEAMRAACEAAQPRVRVRVQVERVEVEGREKAERILAQTKLLGVDLLVIGQRRSGSSFLGCKRSGSTSGRGLDAAEFLIEHCKCLCVGVQKKGQNAGYLLNTKTHKNFWLLA